MTTEATKASLKAEIHTLCSGLVKSGKAEETHKAKFMRMTDNMDAAALDACVVLCRNDIREACTGSETAKAYALQRISTYATIQRKAKGFKAKRAKGAGRKATAPKAESVKSVADMTDIEACEECLKVLILRMPKLGDSERKAFKAKALTAINNILTK